MIHNIICWYLMSLNLSNLKNRVKKKVEKYTIPYNEVKYFRLLFIKLCK